MISLQDVESRYVTKEKKVINLQNINLAIGPKESIAIVGKTNYERTALLRCLACLDYPRTGDFKFDKFNFTALTGSQLIEAKRNIGYINQEKSLLKNQNVFHNVASFLIVEDTPKNIWVNKVHEILSLLSLTSKANLYPRQLTKYQKALVCIGRALATNPKILICDDITGGLDPKSASLLTEQLLNIKEKRSLSMVLGTNDLELIKNACDRVVVVNNGRITEIASTENFFLSPKSTIGKEYIKAKYRLELPISIRKNLKANIAHNNLKAKAIVRSIFKNNKNAELILGEIIEKLETKVNIISAHQEYYKNSILNLMLIELNSNEENLNKAISLLNENKINSEVLGYVE